MILTPEITGLGVNLLSSKLFISAMNGTISDCFNVLTHYRGQMDEFVMESQGRSKEDAFLFLELFVRTS